MQLKIAQQRAEADSHIEIGMQVELVAGKNPLFGARTAADASVALQHGDTQTGARQVSGECQPIVARADNDSVELSHRPDFSYAYANNADSLHTRAPLFRRARACRGHPRLLTSSKQDVDGRDKPGHDKQRGPRRVRV